MPVRESPQDRENVLRIKEIRWQVHDGRQLGIMSFMCAVSIDHKLYEVDLRELGLVGLACHANSAAARVDRDNVGAARHGVPRLAASSRPR